jgi:hypothetical protein
MQTMLLINTIVKSLIVIVCVVGFMFSLNLVRHYKKSIFGVLALFLSIGFPFIAVGKIFGIISNITGNGRLGSLNEMISVVGLVAMLVGLVLLDRTAKKKLESLNA